MKTWAVWFDNNFYAVRVIKIMAAERTNSKRKQFAGAPVL